MLYKENIVYLNVTKSTSQCFHLKKGHLYTNMPQSSFIEFLLSAPSEKNNKKKSKS